jgi:hypothetical protein
MWLAWYLVVFFCIRALSVQLRVDAEPTKRKPVRQGIANVVTMLNLATVAAIVWVWM